MGKVSNPDDTDLRPYKFIDMSRVARTPLISKSSNPRKERGHGKGGKKEVGGEGRREGGRKEGRKRISEEARKEINLKTGRKQTKIRTHTHNLIQLEIEIYKKNLYIKKIKRDVSWLCTTTT